MRTEKESHLECKYCFCHLVQTVNMSRFFLLKAEAMGNAVLSYSISSAEHHPSQMVGAFGSF